jgi:hypothetical protein
MPFSFLLHQCFHYWIGVTVDVKDQQTS